MARIVQYISKPSVFFMRAQKKYNVGVESHENGHKIGLLPPSKFFIIFLQTKLRLVFSVFLDYQRLFNVKYISPGRLKFFQVHT